MTAVPHPGIREIGTPTPGLYRTRLVKGGPWVAARIWSEPPTDPVTGETLDRSWVLRCSVDGRGLVDPGEWWTKLHGPIAFDEWHRLRQASLSTSFAPHVAVNFNTSTPAF